VKIHDFNTCESASLPLYNFFHSSLTRTIFSLSRRVTRILHNNLLTWRERIWRLQNGTWRWSYQKWWWDRCYWNWRSWGKFFLEWWHDNRSTWRLLCI
jgi:hypothetical protein